jgi:hypothetical protein
MKSRIPRLLALSALAALVASAPGLAQAPQATPGAGGNVIDASSMKGPEIRNLMLTKPDNTQIKLGNTIVTVGQMKAHDQKQRTGSSAGAKTVAPVRHKPANLDASNAKVVSHTSQLANDPNAQKQAKLRDEAWDLNEKLKTASPAEKTQIQQRLQKIDSEMKIAPGTAK